MKRLFCSAAVIALGLSALASPAHADEITVSPIPGLSGSYATGDPTAVDVDAAGGRWIASFASVRYFPRNSTTATRVIQGNATGFTSILAVTADSDGWLYVADQNDSIRIFAPGADGDVSPSRIIQGANTGISQLSGIDVDATGYIHVSDAGADSISTFTPSATGNASPIHRIVGPRTQLDEVRDLERRGSKIYAVAWGSNAVVVFTYGQSGDVGPERVIGGSRSGLVTPRGLAIDDAGNLYVLNGAGSPRHIIVFPGNVDGNVTPRRVVGVTNRSQAYNAIAIDPWRRVTAAHISSGSTDQLAPIITEVASAPRAPKVSGSTKAKTRTLTWAPPAKDGFTPVTGYQVVVKAGSVTKYSVLRSAAQRSLPMTRAKLGKGTKVALVRARNATGWGPWVQIKFAVK